MRFDLTSSTTHRKNGVKHKYSSDEIDYFYCYNIERDKSFFIKTSDKLIGSIVIRYQKTNNFQNVNVNYEEDYLFENVIENLIKGS